MDAHVVDDLALLCLEDYSLWHHCGASHQTPLLRVVYFRSLVTVYPDRYIAVERNGTVYVDAAL